MKISVIVPTYCRQDDLKKCLCSLLDQHALPQEILVVDNSPDGCAEAVVRPLESMGSSRGVFIRYVQGKVNSLPAARNLGIDQTDGDILVFIDDDVVLDRFYLEEIRKVYKSNPEVAGVQGFMNLPGGSLFRECAQGFFFWFHLKRNQCRVLPSVSATYPRELRTMIPCQWMSGANHSYRRSLLADLRYDEKLLKYADGEDLDLSYRVYKVHRGGLWITPQARCVHKGSMESRTLGRELIRMQEIYGFYLFWKLFEPSLGNLWVYGWSRFGRLLFALAKCVRQWFALSAVREVLILLGVYGECLFRWRQIRDGKLEFFNASLRGGQSNVQKKI